MAKRKTSKPPNTLTSAEIRQSFLDFFEEHGHTIVPSASLVPGEDQTLLFTNAGMVQFKDVFLGTGSRPYSRAVDSQKCMRVAGKHNDLDDVGRDDTHHTFFEMLGNWSFGDYYKKEAITWAWQLLTDVWELDKEKIWTTCFEDELGEIPRDDEAADFWRQQPGFVKDHVLFFGREENFWEMAETGPCGPDSEIHYDQGHEFCNKQDDEDHVCRVNGDCQRYLELWNLVFIQYNRTSPKDLEPLPNKHVDTGMGFERIVSVLQNVDSNYKTDLFVPILKKIQHLTGHDTYDQDEYLTPYRVIADHVRAATFLIADGVVPGNVGRNYVCRMIIRRASRFGAKIDLTDPFMAQVAETVIENYGEFYPEIAQNEATILQTLTEEEKRFQHTIDSGVAHLMDVFQQTEEAGVRVIEGERAFDLYATYGLPVEITRDIAREHGLEVEEEGFRKAMELHRLASSVRNGTHVDETQDQELYRGLYTNLQAEGRLDSDGVVYEPYDDDESEISLLSLIKGGQSVRSATRNDRVSAVIPRTHFYVEAGGQVSDTGTIVSTGEPRWEILVAGTREPIRGLIVHDGRVLSGTPTVGDTVIARVDEKRRWDIMRNHTATHLLHAALRTVLGEHARQAGSLVAPDRLRFDFTHSKAMSVEEKDKVEQLVNQAILENHTLKARAQSREEAISEGAMALFGETYSDTVRTISIGDEQRLSYELCGGTHVPETGVIGTFVITSEGSVASGIRRIEAVTGRGADILLRSRMQMLQRLAERFGTSPDDLEEKVDAFLAERDNFKLESTKLRVQNANSHYQSLKPQELEGITILSGVIPDTNADTLRQLTDRFRTETTSGVAVLATVKDDRPLIIAAISEDLVKRGLHAGDLVTDVAKLVGGTGGGKPALAQAGGKDAEKLPEALAIVPTWVESKLG
jgi:alanyl-tRNA synthetase